MSSHNDPKIMQRGRLIRNQAISVLNALKRHEEYHRIPENIESNLKRLYDEAVELYGVDVKRLVTDPPGYPFRVIDAMACAESLIDFLDFGIGDPVALRVIESGVDAARWAMKQGLMPYAVLICRVLTEQTMKRLCDRYDIEYPPSVLPGTLAESLQKEKGGPLEKHQRMELQAKLSFEGDVLHGKVTPEREEVSGLIEWTDRFIDRWLDRNGT